MSIFKELDWNDAHSLEDFLNWFMHAGPVIGKVPFNKAFSITNMRDDTRGYTINWYKKGPFQVQLVVMDPNSEAPNHRHPNMDSFELYVGGQINFYKNGELSTTDFNTVNLEENYFAPNRGDFLRITPETMHSGEFGPAGAVFFSVQKWLNGVEPRDVSEDWEGDVYSEQHKNKAEGAVDLVD
jgi:hypothetical protein